MVRVAFVCCGFPVFRCFCAEASILFSIFGIALKKSIFDFTTGELVSVYFFLVENGYWVLLIVVYGMNCAGRRVIQLINFLIHAGMQNKARLFACDKWDFMKYGEFSFSTVKSHLFIDTKQVV